MSTGPAPISQLPPWRTHVVPSDTHVTGITEALASEGARVHLREASYGELA